MANSNFSQTQQAGEPCLPCQMGNLFYLDMPDIVQKEAQIAFSVNGKITPILPVDQSYKLLNDLLNTTGRLSIKVGGKNITLLEDIGQCTAPEDLKVVVGTEKPEIAFDKNQGDEADQRMMPTEVDVVTIQVREHELPEGVYNIGEISEEILDKIGDTIFGVFDESLDSTIRLFDEGKNFTISNLPSAIIEVLGANKILNDLAEKEIQSALSRGGNSPNTSNRLLGGLRRNPAARLKFKRELIRAFLRQDIVSIKLFPSGYTLLSFKAKPRIRTSFGSFRLKGQYKTSFFESSAKMAGGNVGSVASGALKGFAIIGISLVIYSEVDDFMDEDTVGDWSDLFVGLGVEMSKMVVSAIIGSALTAIGLVLVGAVVTMTAPVWLVISVGAVASIAVGAIINAVDDHYGIKKGIKKAVNNNNSFTRDGRFLPW
uniref:Uncharacterized protein n=1 Tax=Marinomonas sp. (strain MWYL1) TaxID=400668 RepID=A6VUI5_MARMS